MLSYFILLFLSTTDALGSFGYFNGTSYVSLSSTWRITQNTALSFRTCSGGELLHQRGANNDSLTLSVHNSSVVFQWNINGINSSIIIGDDLASSDWLFAQFTFIFGVLRINISRSSTILFSSIIATNSFRSYILQADLAGETSLYVGRNFRGCIYEGPNVILSSNDSVIEDTSVDWDSCPLQADCAKGG